MRRLTGALLRPLIELGPLRLLACEPHLHGSCSQPLSNQQQQGDPQQCSKGGSLTHPREQTHGGACSECMGDTRHMQGAPRDEMLPCTSLCSWPHAASTTGQPVTLLRHFQQQQRPSTPGHRFFTSSSCASFSNRPATSLPPAPGSDSTPNPDDDSSSSSGGGGGGGSGGKEKVPQAQKVVWRRPPKASVDISSIEKKQQGPKGFMVLEFFPNGVAKDWKQPVSPQKLGIHPRDLSLFHVEDRLTRQRATITARENSIFFKTEAVRGILSADKAVVFKSKSERENQNIIVPMLQAITAHEKLPFEMCVMEVLLYTTVAFFERKTEHLDWMLETVMHDLQAQSMAEPFATVSNETMIQQLVPLSKALAAARNDAKETCEAIQGILDDDRMLAAICLSEQRIAMHAMMGEDCGDGWSGGENSLQQLQPQSAPQRRQPGGPAEGTPASMIAVHRVPVYAVLQATRMLQSYLREMSSVVSHLVQMEEDMDSTRESWRMRLDSARNHLMLLNLWLSMVSISLTISVVLPSAFGMNIQHGMEEMIWVFYAVTGFSILAGLASYPIAFYFYRLHWKKNNALELNKVNRLRMVLMQHLDDLDDILKATDHVDGAVDRVKFGEILKDRLPHLTLKSEAVDFLFQQLDKNKDGSLTPDERSPIAPQKCKPATMATRIS